MVLILKAYLVITGTKPEIRRIAVTPNVTDSVTLLAERVTTLFPQLQGKTFNLFWIDDEGDEIIITSDMELAQAVACAEESLLKIYIRGSGNIGSQGAPVVNEKHPHIFCDGCNGEIEGFRYKCLQCPDYDLCTTCNTQGIHPEHDMLKLAKPVNVAHNWYFAGWKRFWQSLFGHHFPLPEFDGQSPQKCPAFKDRHRRHEGAPFHPHKRCKKNRYPFDFTKLTDAIESCANQIGVTFDLEIDASESDENECGKQKKNGGGKNSSSPKPVEKTSPEPEKKDQVEDIPIIDLDQAPEKVTEKPVEKDVPLSSTTSGTSSPPTETGARPKSTMRTGLFPTAALAMAAKALDDWTMVNAASLIEDDLPPVETTSKVVEATAPPPPAQEKESSDFPEQPTILLPSPSVREEEEQIPINLRPEVASAVRNMLAMGFTNEGGWLVRLLDAKGGNISEALDSIYRR